MTDISGIQAVGKGYGLGIFTPQTSVRNKPPDPKISIFKASDSGRKQQDLNKLELVGTKVKKHSECVPVAQKNQQKFQDLPEYE